MNIYGLQDAYSEEAVEEFRLQGREDTKDQIQEAMMARIKAFYVTMNFVPLVLSRNDQTRTVDSKYEGKPEEALRMQEYVSILDSLDKQVEIVDMEDYFSVYAEQDLVELSPAVYPAFLDALADEKKFELAEANCRKFVKAYRAKQEQFEQFPEFAEITQKVEYLGFQEHYKKEFHNATGYLNPNTTYSRYIRDLIDKGAFAIYTGLYDSEIDERIDSRISEYNEENRQEIRGIYDSTIAKYENARKKQIIREIFEGKIKLISRKLGPKKKYKSSSKVPVTRVKSEEQATKKQDDKKTSVRNGKDTERE